MMAQGLNTQLDEKKLQPKAEVISLYQAQEKIYPRSVFGYFAKWRWVIIWLTQLFFYGMPWIQWGQRQAFLFDLDAKRFYIFNLILYPQDLIYLTAILIISALSLFLFTAVMGRLWCGYSCPQTVYTEIFMWIEKKIEGDRPKRMKLDAAPWSIKKLFTKSTKQFFWIIFALWTGFTFVGYFTPIRELMADFTQLQVGSWDMFWVLFYGFATYGNAGYMREQVCKYMCPYARFQSAMFDNDTLIVTYDDERGEPRGVGAKRNQVKSKALGDCVDCGLCVQVCPTGIDIRKGLQYECIGCGACADVCNTVMDKINKPHGLIKYTTQNAINRSWSRFDMVKRILRPRVLIYSAVLWALIIALGVSLWNRPLFKVDIVRDRQVLARLVEGGMLENIYRMQIMNATESTHEYRLKVSGLNDMKVSFEGATANNLIKVAPAEARWIVVSVDIPDGTAEPGSHPIVFDIQSLDSKEKIKEESIFLVPR